MTFRRPNPTRGPPEVWASTKRGGGWVISASFVVSFALTALPLPEWAVIWRPAWVALVLTYWCIALPQRVGVGVGWMAGLMLDVLTGTLLGQHALGLSVVAFVAHKSHQRVRVFPPWQQALSIFPLVFIYLALVFWVNSARGVPVVGWAYVAGPLTSMLLWPWLFIVLRDVRRKFSVR
ncbi:MAG: rod shape-determining protein MreD [Gammaproteobacteria bacterium]|jgi:rod shape-determining protein MreD